MCTDIGNLLNILSKTGKNYDFEKINKAYIYAKELHEGQFRNSGEEYITHPVAVAEIVAGLEIDTDSICAALLHDTIEDCGTKTDYQKIYKYFGEEVAMLVDGLTKLVQIKFENKEEEHMKNLRKMFLAMSKDVRVIFIKLCDRLHNMRTLDAKPEEKRRITALETMHVYAPIAHRLGMQRIKQELEALALSYLDPIGYNEVKKDIEKKYGTNLSFIENVRTIISDKLTEADIKFSLEGRVKSIYSIYKKMYNRNKSFDEIYDFYALRIVVNTQLECYTALGIIHEMFNSVPGRFKDYISTPKPNLYKSLHTTVIGRDGIPFEVQIRTWEMHYTAEYGVAANWKYKSGEKSKQEMDDKLGWIAKLLEDDNYDPDEFLRLLKIDIFHDEIVVFTPKGDLVSLPQGATVIDFAYAIHSAVGNKMIGAKINGMIASFDSMPQNGEIVDILTSSISKGPSRHWLRTVKTAEAKNKIRQWFKKEKRPENIEIGKSEIDKELKKYSRPYTEQQKLEILSNVSRRVGIQEIEDLYNTIGYGGLVLSKISSKLKDEFDKIVKSDEMSQNDSDDNVVVLGVIPKSKKNNNDIIVDDLEGCQVKLAKCCTPIPGDKDIIGFITKGFGISIHKMDCPNVKMNITKPEYKDRWVKAHWSHPSIYDSEYEASIQIIANSKVGLVKNVINVLDDLKSTVLQTETSKENSNGVNLSLVVSCKNVDHVKSIISRINAIPNVVKVTRRFS